MLTDGKITGAEYFGIFNKNEKINFKGLEEENIYKENFIILSKIYENRILLENKIFDISSVLNDAKTFVCSFAVKSLDELVDCYKKGYISQSKYFSYLVSLSKKRNIPLFKYKTIRKYLDLEKYYKDLNFNKVKKELFDINIVLADKMTYHKYSKIKELNKNYPLQYYKEIKKYLDDNSSDENYGKKYKNFYIFCDYLQNKNDIDLVQLLNEEQIILTDLYSSFSQTLTEKNLIFLRRFIIKK